MDILMQFEIVKRATNLKLRRSWICREKSILLYWDKYLDLANKYGTWRKDYCLGIQMV